MRDAALGKTRAFSGGFFTQRRLRRILELAGHPISLGWPKSDDHVAIWGNSPTAHRGLRMMEKTGAKPLFVEDAFLRSLFPARVKGMCLSSQAASGVPPPHPGSPHRSAARTGRAVLPAGDRYLPAQAGSALPGHGTAPAYRGAYPPPLRGAPASPATTQTASAGWHG